MRPGLRPSYLGLNAIFSQFSRRCCPGCRCSTDGKSTLAENRSGMGESWGLLVLYGSREGQVGENRVKGMSGPRTARDATQGPPLSSIQPEPHAALTTACRMSVVSHHGRLDIASSLARWGREPESLQQLSYLFPHDRRSCLLNMDDILLSALIVPTLLWVPNEINRSAHSWKFISSRETVTVTI